MKTFKELDQEQERINKEWNNECKKIFGPAGCYSFPFHQLRAIDRQIRNQQLINCSRPCPHCGALGCHYGIEDGRFVYFCPACDNLIN